MHSSFLFISFLSPQSCFFIFFLCDDLGALSTSRPPKLPPHAFPFLVSFGSLRGLVSKPKPSLSFIHRLCLPFSCGDNSSLAFSDLFASIGFWVRWKQTTRLESVSVFSFPATTLWGGFNPISLIFFALSLLPVFTIRPSK